MKYVIVLTIQQTCDRRKVLTIFIDTVNIDIIYSEHEPYEKTFQKNIARYRGGCSILLWTWPYGNLDISL